MAEFGWAFVKGNLLTSSAPPSGAVQFNDGNSKLAASEDLVFVAGSTSQLNLTGTLNVSGTINANQYNVNVTNQNVTNLTATGSTKFGNSADDIHQYTGSINVLGGISSSANVSASAFFGNGSNLSGITTSPAGSDKQIQFNNSNNFGASSNLVFDNGKLGVGTSSPEANLHIYSGDASIAPSALADELVVEGAGSTGISILTPNNQVGRIYFGDSDNSSRAYILYDHSSDIMKFSVASANRLVINNVGNVGIGLSFPENPDHKLAVIGDISASVNVSASAFYGNGSNLTNLAGGSNNQIQFNNSGELGGSSGLTYNGSKLHVAGEISSSLAVSASAFHGDGSNLSGIATTLDQVTNNGNTTTNAMTASALNLTGLAAGTAASTKFLALDSGNNVVLTSSVGGGGGSTIGDAEDGSYTDGLFSDFLSTTPIGTAIDKFNEILKIIVPGPAPAVDRINYTNTNGIDTKLSFETQPQAPSGYTDVGSTGSFTSPPGINDQYTVATSGEDFRLGVYDGTQEITGVVNFHVSQELKSSQVNYSHDAFGNAESGSLKLIVNGAVLHTLNLTASGAGNPNTGSAVFTGSNGSGFFDVSVTASAKDQNGSLYNIFQHRTSKYVIDPQDQRKGWNHAEIKHVYGSTTYNTNFVQWFNDTDASSNAMSVSNPRVSFTGQGSKYLSGVQYFRSASLTYRSDVLNAYKFTYPTGNVLTFNVSSNLTAIGAGALDATDGTDLFNKVLQLTKSTSTTDDTMLDDSTTISLNLTHPLKTNLTSTGSVVTNQILIYNVDTANNNLNEYFDLETFRITSAAYENQANVTAGAATWNSQHHMTSSGASGHEDGLLYYNGRLYSPKQGANAGNFSTLTNGPLENPNYSTVSGTRRYFRKVQNTSGSPVRDLKITTSKQTRFNSSTLSSNNAKVSIKIPGSTGWMDISNTFNYGQVSDNHGALIDGASDNSNTSATSTGNGVHCITFGTESVAADDYVVIKIEADAAWTGFVNTLQFQLGASDVSDPTESQALDDIDLDDAAGVTAKLSFGGDNTVTGYTNVAGGVGSMSAVNSNGVYTDNGDTNRGVFKVAEVMNGTLNEDVAANGSNYTANSFKNAYTGSLLLIVNDTTASTLSLANLNTNNNLSSDTGFSVGAVGFSTTTDGIPDYTKPYRQGTYSIGTSQQRSGWNYARVIHRIGASDTVTNYVQWVVDPSGNIDNTAVSAPTISNFNHPTTYYQSGIGYFASNPSGTFDFTGSNFYSNVYQNGTAISFPTTTNCSVSNIRVVGSGITTFDSAVSSCDMPALNNTDDCETTSIEVTGTMLYNGGTSISGAFFSTPDNVTVTGRILHPHKSDKTTNSASKNAFMRYSGSIGSSTLTSAEYFGLETYRMVSGNYPNQTNLTDAANKWNSQTEMDNGGSHDDGMVTANGYLISPFKIGNAGDTRNVAQGGSLQAPTGNPNYSTLTNDIRTYYRQFRYTGGSATPNITLTLRGDATLRSMDASYPAYYEALDASSGVNKNVNVELRVSTDSSADPDQSTTWLDCGKIIIPSENKQTLIGAGVRSGAASGEDVTIDTNGLALALDLGTSRLIPNQYYAIKISAHKNWTGYISRIEVAYG